MVNHLSRGLGIRRNWGLLKRRKTRIGEAMPLNISALGLKELTPARFACTMTMSCPGVFKNKVDQSYLIIGKKCDADNFGLNERVGEEEAVVKIPSDLLEGALWTPSIIRNTLSHFSVMLVGASLAYFLK